MIRPVGNGVICGATFCPTTRDIDHLANRSYRTLRDGLLDGTFQAFHAWLTSSGPSGTKHTLKSEEPNLVFVPALEGNRPPSKIERIVPASFGGMYRLNLAAHRQIAWRLELNSRQHPFAAYLFNHLVGR
jgi:hypothetical protein